MKLIQLTTLVIAADTNFLSLMGSGHAPEIREFATAMQATLERNTDKGMVEDYFHYSLGNLLTDEGLEAFQSETLSMDDDHPFDEDMEYFYEQASEKKASFGTVTRYFDGVLSILYYAAE